MNHRELFLSVLAGKNPGRIPFFPDITDWYGAMRSEPGQPLAGGAGAFMSDSHPAHKVRGRMPAKYKDFTLMDFYRKFDWGFPVHHYGWCKRELTGDVKSVATTTGNEQITRLQTPKGELVKRSAMAADGSWCPIEHFCKTPRDLEIMRVAVEATRYVPRFENVQAAMKEMGGMGIGDLPLHRSPFGKLVHEYMGFEQVVYALYEDAGYLEDFMRFQEVHDLQIVKLAGEGPEPIVIMSDHADENLIAPNQYEKYCIPYYQKINKILHEKGKYVSTHLDGNFKGFFPILHKTGFDLLDGCTPAPMFNYEVEELAAVMPKGMYAYCGVPATLFCQRLPTKDILSFADRIAKALKGRVILNIGDILPPDGDIEQVIALGQHVRGL
jgi:hypothetical protein